MRFKFAAPILVVSAVAVVIAASLAGANASPALAMASAARGTRKKSLTDVTVAPFGGLRRN